MSEKEQKTIAYSHFQLGVDLLTKGQYARALEHMLQAKKYDPSNSLYLNHLGLTYYFLKEHERAIIELKAALDEKDDYSEAHNNLGRLYIDTRDFRSARHHLNKALSDLTYPNKDKVWLNMGLSYFFENRYKKSETFFLRSISLNRENCLAYNYYGRSQIEQNKFKKAVKAFDQAIYHCNNSGFDEPHYYSAISLFRLGHKSKAIARLQEGKKKFPKGTNRGKIDEMINLMRITETK